MNKYSSAIITLLSILTSTSVQATCPTFYSLTNGTTADADKVMSNFNHILECPNFTGNVGIGTANPSVKLTVSDDSASLRLQATSNSTGYYTQFQQNYSYVDPFRVIVRGGGSTDVLLRYSDTYGGGGLYFLNDKIFVNGSGNVGIGTTSPSYTLHVNGSVAGTSAYNNLSDVRLKKKIEPITNALNAVEKLRGVHFAWRTPRERDVGKNLDLPDNTPQIGFIAQEVAAVLPEAVTVAGDKEAIMSMQESKIVPLLVEAIKELKAANEMQAVAFSKLQHEVSELRSGRGVTTDENILHRATLNPDERTVNMEEEAQCADHVSCGEINAAAHQPLN